MYNGSLVRIRHQTLFDLEILANFQNQEHVMAASIEIPRFTYKEHLLRKYRERLDRPNDNDMHLVIETITGKVIGAIGLDLILWKNGIAYLYQYIGDDNYLVGGFREEAIQLFLEFMFLEGNIRKLKTNVLASDTQSLQALMTNGFEVEVINCEDVLKSGSYVDVYELARFREDYLLKK